MRAALQKAGIVALTIIRFCIVGQHLFGHQSRYLFRASR
jgi:hypothetical protein